MSIKCQTHCQKVQKNSAKADVIFAAKERGSEHEESTLKRQGSNKVEFNAFQQETAPLLFDTYNSAKEKFQSLVRNDANYMLPVGLN